LLVTGHVRHSSLHHYAPGSNLPNSVCALLFVGVREVRSPNGMSQQYSNISCMRRQSPGRWKEDLVQCRRRWWVSLWREYAEPCAIALNRLLKNPGGTSLQPDYWSSKRDCRSSRRTRSRFDRRRNGLRPEVRPRDCWDLFQHPVQYDGTHCCGERSQPLRRDLPPLIRAFISRVTRLG
jgi:hypothetical protein